MKPLEIKHRVIGGGEPLICVPVVEQDAQSVIREITYLSQSTADMIEWEWMHSAILQITMQSGAYLRLWHLCWGRSFSCIHSVPRIREAWRR